MPKLIKNNAAQENSWVTIADQEDLAKADLANGKYLVPLELWQQKTELHNTNIGVWLNGDTNPSLLIQQLKSAPAIAIQFSAFADGRGFSLARILREDCDFSGELQATGEYMQDQLYYLKRCGFDAFAVADDANIDSMLVSLQDFTNNYQASHDEPRPLFRRR